MHRTVWVALATLLALSCRAQALDKRWKKQVFERLDNEDYENDGVVLIGVLTQPAERPHHTEVSGPVVSWIESAGGRVVPVRYNAPEREIRETFGKLNGLFFPGGSADLWYGHPYFDAAALLYRLTLEANEAGTLFPLYGTCLGFEMLHILASNVTREDLMFKTVGQDDTDNVVKFTDTADDSLFFRGWPDYLLRGMTRQRSKPTYNAHIWSVPPSAYKDYPALSSTFDILSTSLDSDGKEYVSTVEGRNLPLFSTQWHPEKVAYEFDDVHVPHTRTAIQAGLFTAQLLVDVARLNPTQVPYEEQVRLVINNYERRFVAAHPKEFSRQLPDTMWFVPDRDERDSGDARGWHLAGGRRAAGVA